MAHDPVQMISDKKFVVCGSVCRSEIRVLAKHANVIAIVDDFLAKQVGGNRVFGIEVIDSDSWVELVHNDPSFVSCILTPGTNGYQYFVKLASQWNIQTLDPLQYLQLLKVGKIDRRGEAGRLFWYGDEFFVYTLENLDRLIDLRLHLEDAFSRLSWLCILAYRMTLNPFYLDACAVGHLYATYSLNSYSTNRRFLKFHDDEIYVDGGAFVGDTISSFLNATGDRFRHIHSFEPSSENNRKIRQMLIERQGNCLHPLAPRVTLHEKGLWDADGLLAFNPGRSIDALGEVAAGGPLAAHFIDGHLISHIYDRQQEESASFDVPVTTIDEATDRLATFIKLEIEGAELKALNGARETIARNRPKMAISIYHKPEDLESLTDFVLDTDQHYKLGFRQHNRLVPDAMVLYCY